MPRTLRRFALSFILLGAATGCDDDPTDGTGTTSTSTSTSSGGGSGGAGGGGYAGPCTALSVGETSIFFGTVSRFAVEAPVSPVLPDLTKTRLQIELYEDDGSMTLGPLVPGTFSFATAPDDDYGTCQHCLILVGSDLGGQPKRAFYAKNGTMTLDKLDALDFTVAAGSVAKAELVEVIQNPDFTWEEKPGGACFYVDRWDFDTTVVHGGKCDSAEQCPNEVQQICDPSTGKCGEGQCSLTFDPPFCADGEVCLSQLFPPEGEVAGPAIGACYTTCDASSPASCGDGLLCRPLGPTQDLGICLKRGDAKTGEACVPADTSTGCEGAAVCNGEPGVCAPICAYLTETSGCPSNTFCALSNLCEPASHGDAAPIGGTCSAASPFYANCGVEGDAFRGLCMNFFPADPELVCERLCRTDAPDCPPNETCLALFSNTAVGICHPTPVCGDGEVDVIGGEICDDANTSNGDACSSDCLTPDLGALCSVAEPISAGAVVSGDTTGEPTGYPSACDPFIATPMKTYSFLPPGPGRVTVKLTSAADLGVSVLADCADGASELKCQNAFGDDTVVVQLASAPQKPLLLGVRGGYPLAVGPFGLSLDFTPQVCGDHVVAGAEACDDGNTNGGDGCAADCTSIEWAAVCAALPTLPLGASTPGMTGDDVFDLSGVCSSFYGGGGEKAYAFTAPQAGKLALTLTQPADDFTIYVEDGCGPADTQPFVACSNFAQIGSNEHVEVELASGQTVTVIVDGFGVDDAGAFSLTASFGP